MTSGTTTPIYLQQDPPAEQLVANDSYLSIWLHSAQAYVDAGWMRQPAYLVCSTEVNSTFLPGHTSQGIHRVETISKNTPCALGLRMQLTDWLPAVPEKTVTVTVKLGAVMDNPFGKVTAIIGNLGLASKLSLVGTQVSASVQVAEVVGKMLSAVLEEGKERTLLTLRADFNINDLQAGYYAVVARHGSGDVPRILRLRGDSQLENPKAPLGENLSYAILRVSVLKARGEEAARESTWWNVLQDGVLQAKNADISSESKRRKANETWRAALLQAERLARQERSFLLREIRQLIQVAALEAQQALQPAATLEASNADLFTDVEQQVLGVSDLAELRDAVTAYRAMLEAQAGRGECETRAAS